ncbi:MAG: hemolysin III family protein [Rhodobacteraceae bacterium]|nr:hemolysin III family protein [Paracoccaceae bacterium]
MAVLLPERKSYSRAEVIGDAVVHASGAAFALIAVPVLVVAAVLVRGGIAPVAAVSVYGACLLAMILFSALYNTLGRRRWTATLKRLDHSAIYAKIAGTYTPFAVLSGSHLWLLAGLWAAALAGIALKLASPDRWRRAGLVLCLAMGWAGLAPGVGLVGGLPAPVLALILAGGVVYTAGVVFYLLDRLPFHYMIWHVMVLAASAFLYAAVTVHVIAA